MVVFLPLLLAMVQFAFGAYETGRRSVFLTFFAVGTIQSHLAQMGVILWPEMTTGIWGYGALAHVNCWKNGQGTDILCCLLHSSLMDKEWQAEAVTRHGRVGISARSNQNHLGTWPLLERKSLGVADIPCVFPCSLLSYLMGWLPFPPIRTPFSRFRSHQMVDGSSPHHMMIRHASGMQQLVCGCVRWGDIRSLYEGPILAQLDVIWWLEVTMISLFFGDTVKWMGNLNGGPSRIWFDIKSGCSLVILCSSISGYVGARIETQAVRHRKPYYDKLVLRCIWK
jgi:hypothetical protein